MKYYVNVDESRCIKNGYSSKNSFQGGWKTFSGWYGAGNDEKFAGVAFPKTCKNAWTKTTRLMRILDKVDTFLLAMPCGMSWREKKDVMQSVVTGRKEKKNTCGEHWGVRRHKDEHRNIRSVFEKTLDNLRLASSKDAYYSVMLRRFLLNKFSTITLLWWPQTFLREDYLVFKIYRKVVNLPFGIYNWFIKLMNIIWRYEEGGIRMSGQIPDSLYWFPRTLYRRFHQNYHSYMQFCLPMWYSLFVGAYAMLQRICILVTYALFGK